MKKFIIIMAVAILGALAYNATGGGNHPALQTGNSSVNGTLGSGSSSGSSSNTETSNTQYKDGNYTGTANQTPYGIVQIAVNISGGKIANVDFLQMPNELGHSQEITYAAEPLLRQTTLQAQSANIDFVSGATSTSIGYEQSLQAALNQAQVS